MRVFLGIAGTALAAILLHRLRSLVTTVCVIAVVLPYVAGLGLSKGIHQEADDSVRFGADLYVTASQVGRTLPIPAAAALFDQQGLATDLMFSCQPGYQEQVRQAILRSVRLPLSRAGESSGPRVTTRTDLEALLPRGLLHREGIFNLLFLLAFVVGILVVLVTSGLGLAERRREIGILKATGWQTDEVLLRGLVESLALSLAGACVAVLLAWAL